MAEFVVAPRIYIGVVIDIKGRDRAHDTQHKICVQIMLSFCENFLLRTSSIESLVGSTQKGVANITTTIIPKSET